MSTCMPRRRSLTSGPSPLQIFDARDQYSELATISGRARGHHQPAAGARLEQRHQAARRPRSAAPRRAILHRQSLRDRRYVWCRAPRSRRQASRTPTASPYGSTRAPASRWNVKAGELDHEPTTTDRRSETRSARCDFFSYCRSCTRGVGTTLGCAPQAGVTRARGSRAMTRARSRLDVENADRPAPRRIGGAEPGGGVAHGTEASIERGADLRVALADAGEDDLGHRRAGEPSALHLTARDHVHAGAERAQ